MKSTWILCLFILNTLVELHAQDTSTELKLPDFIPSSPTAYELTKYGDIPVNESSGIANISIPLFEFSTKDLSLPISLSYSSSGVKVDQVATNVGMNWNLNIGGVVTRNIRGSIDVLGSANSYPSIASVLDDKANHPGDFYDFVNDVNNNDVDNWEPDLFTFTIDGYSGSFFFKANGDPVLVKRESELKIEVLPLGAGFKITTPKGIAYTFDETEKTKQRSTGLPMPSTMKITTWYLTKIAHFNGDEIIIEYDPIANQLFYMSSLSQTETKYTDLGLDCSGLNNSISKQVNYSYVDQKKIKKISSNRTNGYIEFETSDVRADLAYAYKVDRINLYNKSDELVKAYDLNYTFYKSTKSYSMGAKTWTQINSLGSNHQNFYRMFLTGLEELDVNGTDSNGKKFSFTYDAPTDLPPRLSLSQDYLGFYNGVTNAGLLPDNFLTSDPFFSMTRRGDRTADFSYAKKGLLTKVTYPTGGTTELYYQGKSYPIIEKIKTKESTGATEKITKYYYRSYADVNSGITTPYYYTFSPLYDDIVFDADVHEDCGAHHVTRFNSSSITNLYTTSANDFLYDTVTVVYGDNSEGGAVEKQFSVTNDTNASNVWGVTVYSGGKSNTGLFNGTLEKETILRFDGTDLVPENTMDYTYFSDPLKITTIDSYKGNIRYENTLSIPGPSPITSVWGYDLSHYQTISKWRSLSEVTTTEYFDAANVVTTTTNTYDAGLAGMPNVQKTTASNGELDIIKYIYAPEVISTSYMTGGSISSPQLTAIEELTDQHRFEVIQTERYKDSDDDGDIDVNELLSITRNLYKEFPSSILMLEKIQTNKTINSMEDRIVFFSYDAYGNPQRLSKKDGTEVYYVYGYNNSYPIAKIENAPTSFSGPQDTKISDAVTASNNDVDWDSEETLRIKLELLRIAFPNAMVTTFTYNIPIGLTSTTDPLGITTYYEYDVFNRLKSVKDVDGKIRTHTEYHYKAQ